MKQEPPEDDEFHFCDDCDYISNNESDYQAHVKKNHANAQENVSLESGSSSSSTGRKRNAGQQISNSDLSEIFSKSSAKKMRIEEESQSNPEKNLQVEMAMGLRGNLIYYYFFLILWIRKQLPRQDLLDWVWLPRY